MKRILPICIVIAMLMISLGVTSPAQAVAYGTGFTTSITYINIGTGTAHITVDFYSAGNGTPISYAVPDLAQNAASSLYVGSVGSITPGFQGSAIMSSDQPLGATLVQLPPATSTMKVRPLSNGFSSGAGVVTIPTVLKATFSSHSIFTIQNVDSTGADLTVEFNPVTGSTVTDIITNLPAGSTKYYDMGQTTPIVAATFNGSVKATSVQTGTANPGAIVASVLELNYTNDNGYAFQGMSSGGTTIYMPSAFCNWGPTANVTSAYAVMNIGTTATDVTTTYAAGGTEGPFTVDPGKKRSFGGCTANVAGYIGSATITSTVEDIVAVGKVGGGGISSAFEGFSTGYESIVLPYVRWTSNTNYAAGLRQRVNIAIQNVGTAVITAGTLNVAYYDKNGLLLGTLSNPSDIAIGGKWSSNPSSLDVEFGYNPATGGGAIVTAPAGGLVAVMARPCTYLTPTTAACEDYDGIPIN